MNAKWLTVLKVVRRCVWLAALVAVLFLLLMYKITQSEAAILFVFVTALASSVPLAAITVLIDHVEIEHWGDD